MSCKRKTRARLLTCPHVDGRTWMNMRRHRGRSTREKKRKWDDNGLDVRRRRRRRVYVCAHRLHSLGYEHG